MKSFLFCVSGFSGIFYYFLTIFFLLLTSNKKKLIGNDDTDELAMLWLTASAPTDGIAYQASHECQCHHPHQPSSICAVTVFYYIVMNS